MMQTVSECCNPVAVDEVIRDRQRAVCIRPELLLYDSQ